MKIDVIKITLCLCTLLVFFGCKEYENGPMVPEGGTPTAVSNIKIENLPGAAKVGYTLPANTDLLYVLAVFSSKDGEVRSAKSSLYTNYVLLEGFPDAKPYQVKLYTVSKSEVKSEAVDITVNPKTPHMLSVFNSMKVIPDFGGLNITYENVSKNAHVFTTMVKNNDGKWEVFDKHYSKMAAESYSVRGLEPKEMEFGIFILDQWGNKTETSIFKLTPIYEERADKKLWKLVPLPSDSSVPFYGHSTIEKLWDENVHQQNGATNYFYGHPVDSKALPNWFTIDLGKPYKISRMKVNQYEGSGSYMYTDGNPKVYEIWGNNAAEDSWDNWILLRQCTSIKPSELPIGVRSAEDVEYAMKGEDFGFSIDKPAVRYIRFKLIETWSKQPNMLLDEITLWGQKN